MSNNKWLENTSPPIPENEELRQEELNLYLPVVKDQAYVKPFKNIAQLAAENCDLPVSFVNLIDVDREVNVAATTREIIVLHWASAELKEQTLLSDIPDELVFNLDIEHWKRIVGNLKGNAIKFTSKKGQIELFLSVTDDKPRILKLRVRDTGIGMPEEMCKSFFTGEKWLQRKGTEGEMSDGLGISIIQKCVELHCGQISVESEVERGTTFDIEIPE